jgi:signal transduction histidine kinase
MLEYRPQSIQLGKMVQKTVNILNVTADSKEIEVNVDIDESIFVYADADMLSFTLRNLISNAIKFTNKGGQICVYSSIENDKVEIAVSDNGIGMSNNILEKLFKIDTCHTTNGTDNEMGTGLGLILCNEFIIRNGGKIVVESEVNKGSTFRFSLPVIYADLMVNI